MFTNAHVHQSLSARQPPHSNNSTNDRKVFSAPSFNFPVPLGSTGGNISAEGTPSMMISQKHHGGNMNLGLWGQGHSFSTTSTAFASTNNSANPSPRQSRDFYEDVIGCPVYKSDDAYDSRTKSEAKEVRPGNSFRGSGTTRDRGAKR